MEGKVYPPFSCSFTPQIPELLFNLRCTIAFTTFQAGKLVFLSAKNDQELVQLPRNFIKPMGLAVSGESLALATQDQLLIFKASRSLAPAYPKKPGVYDTIYVPMVSYHTGRVDLHDIAWTESGICAVNTSFSCLIRPSDEYNFVSTWRPNFISELASQDRCHLNGVAVVEEKAKYTTAFSVSNEPQGWREQIPHGGVLINVDNQEIVASDLKMPHSPRWFDGKLYVLQSALGQLLTVDPDNGKTEVIYQREGFARGLAKYRDYLFVGYSKLRQNSSVFGRLEFSKKADQCSISIIHAPTGAFVGEIRYLNSVDEIFDIQIIPDITRPNILNTETDDFKTALITPEATYWGSH